MDFKSISTLALTAILLGACAQIKLVMQPGQLQPQIEDQSAAMEPPPVVKKNPMADVPGDKPLPVLRGAVERIDCKTGKDDLHARIAFEAHGGQLAYFAYYSIWKPRTCSLDFARDASGTKWRLTPDGATRVQTPEGRFLIRTRADAYVFEFEDVQRQKFCGMSGEINGTMTVKRGGTPECSAVGIMDANDEYLYNLRKLK